MAIYKEFSADDIKTQKSFLNQLVDVVNLDISGSTTRRKYQVFVTGGVGPGVTSSLFQTVYDQDFTLPTANAIFDITFGLNSECNTLTRVPHSIDANGKFLFPSNFLMMREKMDVYRLFAQDLLGDADAQFKAKVGTSETKLLEPMFICFKRLFARDKIKRETFVIKIAPTASTPATNGNIYENGTLVSKLYTDASSTTNKLFEIGGEVSTIVDSANTSNAVGMLFLDKGVLVLDMSRSMDYSGPLSGVLDNATVTSGLLAFSGSLSDLLASGSMDDVIDHLGWCRFSGSSVGETSIAFQNQTNINSTLYFCNIGSDEFNYSSNPSFTDATNRVVVIDEGQEETQQSFTFITSIGLYNSAGEILGVGKVSRPILKDNSRNLNLKLRLDY